MTRSPDCTASLHVCVIPHWSPLDKYYNIKYKFLVVHITVSDKVQHLVGQHETFTLETRRWPGHSWRGSSQQTVWVEYSLHFILHTNNVYEVVLYRIKKNTIQSVSSTTLNWSVETWSSLFSWSVTVLQHEDDWITSGDLYFLCFSSRTLFFSRNPKQADRSVG